MNGPIIHGTGGMDLRTAVSLLPTPIVMDHRMARPLRGLTGADYAGLNDVTVALQLSTDHFSANHDVSIDWGKYAPVVRRWERVTGRYAPPPTELNDKGNPRLNPAFSEWMMGWESGWVTDLYISRNDQLRIIGNGVCPQQAHAAITHLLTFCEVDA